MELPSVIVSTRRTTLIPEIVIPARRPAAPRPVATRPLRERPAPAQRWSRPLRGLLVDVYA